MNKVTSWTKSRKPIRGTLVGFKLITVDRNTLRGTLRVKSAYRLTEWKTGANEAEGKSANSFFHMYSSIYDAVLSERLKFKNWLKAREKRQAIIMVRPEGDLVFGLDNNSIYHTFGCKNVTWSGHLLVPAASGKFGFFDVYHLTQNDTRITLKYRDARVDSLASFA